tara:strand:- start:167 stop:565 length:399 start_codon:yes stop_codon:yes gene_type:complete
MKNIHAFLFFAAIMLFSCTVTQTTHSFYHHGTDSVKNNSDFIYVKTGVVGRSSTSYYPTKLRKEQGVVREGLIADAKKNLHTQHPLQANQAYANMTIDILNTSVGNQTTSGVIATEIIIEAVISADIIEFTD